MDPLKKPPFALIPASSGGGFPIVLKEPAETLSTCWPLYLYSAVPPIPRNVAALVTVQKIGKMKKKISTVSVYIYNKLATRVCISSVSILSV